MNLKDYYQVMEVSSHASQEEIKQAYQHLARKYHPDISKEPDAEVRFKEVNEAYEVLKNPQKRADYNASFQIISPYTYAWLRAKRDAWVRLLAQRRAKKNATVRAKLQSVSFWKYKNISIEIPRPKIVLPSLSRKPKQSLKTKPEKEEVKTQVPNIVVLNAQASEATKGEIPEFVMPEPEVTKAEIPDTVVPNNQPPETTQMPKQPEMGPVEPFEMEKTEPTDNSHKTPPFNPNQSKPPKKTSYLPILVGLLLLLLVGIGVGGYLGYQEWLRLQNHQQLITGILHYEEQAIAAFEERDLETQQEILQEAQIKNALVTFYQNSPTPVFTHLSRFEEPVQSEILNDDAVYQTLKNHYYTQIEQEVAVDNFAKAFHLVETLYNKYPYSRELSNKFEEITDRKQRRLAELTQRYMECADQTLAPLLERTHCMAKAREEIEHVGIEHSLPNDSNLSMMYTEEINHAFSERNYDYAEKVLLDWQNLQPQPSKERQALREKLLMYQQMNNIVAELSGRNNSKIIYWLDELNKVPELKREILAMPKVQDNLADYHINQALSILQAPEEGVSVNRRTLRKLKRFLAKNEETESATNTTLSSSAYSLPTKKKSSKKYNSTSSITLLNEKLQECRQHYEAKRLTTGQPGTALDCYQEVLKKYPGNRQALEGLQAIEKSYLLWANNALRKNRLNRVRGYLQRLKKVNPRSTALAQLRQQLKTAVATQKQQQREQQRQQERQQERQQQRVQRQETVSTPQAPPPSQSNASSSSGCADCNCSELLKQLSMGVKPLSSEQRQFFQTQCR
jgi:curved DNA-binding protein CbpA